MTSANQRISNYGWITPYLTGSIHSIIEVGSRDCEDALEFSDLFGCSVVAFEPDPRAFAICKEAITQSKSKLVQIQNLALSDENGVLDFYLYDVGNSSIHPHRTQELIGKTQVSVRRFDALPFGAPTLLIMDTQGSEGKVIKGFGDKLGEVKWICFETAFVSAYQNEFNFPEIHRYLKQNGFEFVASNVSGRGIINFRIMRLRNIFFSLRKSNFRNPHQHEGFFDVLYRNKVNSKSSQQ